VKNDDQRWFLRTALVLVAVSSVAYLVDFALFRDLKGEALWLLYNLAFLPVQVLLVGLVMERLLERREKQSLRQKLNMVVGAFFSEIGTGLLTELTPALTDRDEVRAHFELQGRWKAADFDQAIAYARGMKVHVDLARLDLSALRERLVGRRSFLVGLLQSPILLEHQQFTDLLWAIFHLMEELEARPDLTTLTRADAEHLAGDTRRVYDQLAAEWMAYAQHLQHAYPFLFSLVVRTHPFQDRPSAVIADAAASGERASGVTPRGPLSPPESAR
jgi:hypothetical protein